MKNILILIAFILSFNLFSQEPTLLYMNSDWNHKNDYKFLKLIRGAKILEVDYDSQPKKFKEAVKSVPAIILFDKNNKLKKIWQAGLTMQLTIDPKEIQKVINELNKYILKKLPTARVPDSETVFRTFRAQEVEVNCVDPASKVGHSHFEQLSQRPNVDPSNIDEALGI